MGIKNIGQQGIVFAVFAALFAIFALALPGFLTAANMLTLLQNVAVLGILGLAMAIVVIGRGIDISLIAALAVPPGLVLQMVQDGHSLPLLARAGLCADGGVRPRQRLADRLCRGALAVHDAGVRTVSRRPRPGRAVRARRRAVEPGARRLRASGPGQSARHPDAGGDVRARLHRGRLPAAANPARRLHLCDRRQSQRRARHRHPDPSRSSCCNMCWRR